MCMPDFMALRHVIPIHEDWEVLAFTVRVRNLIIVTFKIDHFALSCNLFKGMVVF